jgi:hypothetical protein
MPATLTFLHTSPIHVPRFQRLQAEMAPSVAARHVVHEALLTAAVEDGGVSNELKGVVDQETSALASISKVILCTCSTLGPVAESFDGIYGARVVRVDRPMAASAVAAGTRVAVVTALESTLGPTSGLLQEEASRAGREVELSVFVARGAWQLFAAGDLEGYLRVVADETTVAASQADVVVLSQAFMEGATRYASAAVPILTSPRSGLAHALSLLTQAAESGIAVR